MFEHISRHKLTHNINHHTPFSLLANTASDDSSLLMDLLLPFYFPSSAFINSSQKQNFYLFSLMFKPYDHLLHLE